VQTTVYPSKSVNKRGRGGWAADCGQFCAYAYSSADVETMASGLSLFHASRNTGCARSEVRSVNT
jgi:hypothetical protein